jgi:hypothetical protein
MCIVAVFCLYLAAIFLFASINMCIVALHARHLVSVIVIPLSPSILSFFNWMIAMSAREQLVEKGFV